MRPMFITGDRSYALPYLPLVSIELLKAVKSGSQIVTGENSGVEEIVREFAHEAGLDISIVSNRDSWDERHREVVAGLDADFVVVHVDAMESSVARSVLEVAASDRVHLVTMAEML